MVLSSSQKVRQMSFIVFYLEMLRNDLWSYSSSYSPIPSFVFQLYTLVEELLMKSA